MSGINSGSQFATAAQRVQRLGETAENGLGRLPGELRIASHPTRRLELVESAEAARLAPIEAQISPQPAEPAPGLMVVHDPYDHRSEMVRALRTELLLRHEVAEEANAVALLSPGSREGRSLLAAELAASFGLLGRRTLLVDADLRCPRQHLLFGVDGSRGLAQAIIEDEPPVLHAVSGMRAMYLLTAGAVQSNPLELLSSSAFDQLVARWLTEFDFVVFDTPPLSRCSDALAVAATVRRVLAVSRADHTPAAEMREMLRRLEGAQAQVLGAVLSHH